MPFVDTHNHLVFFGDADLYHSFIQAENGAVQTFHQDDCLMNNTTRGK